MDKRIYDNYVLAVAKHKNLTKAASSLGLSQPALSLGLNTLEKDLGFKIFNRQATPISFTPEGEIYFDFISKVQILANDLNKRIECIKDTASKKVAIGSPVAYSESLVVGAVHKLLFGNPDYCVSIRTAPLSELIDMASSGNIDCFISTSKNLPANLASEPIKQEKVYLCVPSEFTVNNELMQLNKDNANYYDYSVLSNQKFIFLENTQPLQQSVNSFLEANKIKAVSLITVNQVSTALSFALNGEGICFVTEESLAGNVDLHGVKIYDLPDTLSGREIFVAYDKSLVMTQACEDLIQILKSYQYT